MICSPLAQELDGMREGIGVKLGIEADEVFGVWSETEDVVHSEFG